MKKTKILSLAALFAILTAIFCVTAYAEEITLYVDPTTTVEADAQNGTQEAPYSAMNTALQYAKTTDFDTVVIYLLNDVQGSSTDNGMGIVGKTVKYTAESNEVKFYLPNGTLYPCPPAETGKGAVEFENLTFVRGLSGSGYYDIDFRGFDFTFGENTDVVDSAGKKVGIYINQNWGGERTLDNQIINFNTKQWPNFYVNIGNTTTDAVKGKSTVYVNGEATFHELGSAFMTSGTAFFGTQNYIFNGGSTIRELYFGNASSQKGKRYVQINNGGILDLYTTSDSGSLTSDSYSGVNIIEINGGKINNTVSASGTGGVNYTEPANVKAINAYPNSAEAWKNVTRVVIFNNNKHSDVTVGDEAAIVLRVAADGKAQAVTTEPTEANEWDCELLGFEITLPADKELVYIDGKLAAANDDGLYVVEAAGEHKVTFGNKYTVAIGDTSEKYAPGEVINLPDAPEKENSEHYTFKWTDGTNTYDAGAEYTVTADVEFSESWTANKYTVTFKNGDDTVSEESIEYGNVITAPDAPEKAGHTFDGWYNGEVKFAEGTTVTGNVTYNAKFNTESYGIQITVDPTEGGTVTGGGTYEYGTKATLTATASYGYSFAGWYTADSETALSTDAAYEVEVTAANTYTAKFEKANVEIKGTVVFQRAEGKTPYKETYDDGTVYNNAAKITVYSGSDTVFTGTESEDDTTGITEFTFNNKLGAYRVVIEKNGYAKYDKTVEIKTGEELSNIKLVAGDIKDSYDAVCGDGEINIDDFVRILRGFAAKETDKLFHAVDINEDRFVNVTDLGYIKAAMNK